MPVGFVCILVAIKVNLEDSPGFSPETVEAQFPDNTQTVIPLSFTDYVTAMQAERICEPSLSGFGITGMPDPAGYYVWQVPFVKCDSRRCKEVGEDAATKYCEYQVLGVAPMNEGDAVGKARAESFRDYVYSTYPVLTNASAVHFDYPFVKEFNSNDAIQSYVTSKDYGSEGFPKLGLAVVFQEGSSEKDYAYTIRVNSTNYNSPENEGRPAATTTPNTAIVLDSYAKTDSVCTPEGGTPYLGPLQNSCTGQYIYNGALIIQRLIGDWIISDSGASDAGYGVSESGVQFVSFPSKEYVENGFYSTIAGKTLQLHIFTAVVIGSSTLITIFWYVCAL